MATLTVTATITCTLDIDERDHPGVSARELRDVHAAELARWSPALLARLVTENGGAVAAIDVSLDDETPFVGAGAAVDV